MGKIVIPKNSALAEETVGAISVYYEAGDWMTNDDFIDSFRAKVKDLGETDLSEYTKRTQIGSYFGYIEWEDIRRSQSKRRITQRGKQFYEHYKGGNKSAVFADIMSSLEEVTFGRNNFACSTSDSDIEPMSVFVRASIELNGISNEEFAYLIFSISDSCKQYTDTIREISAFRDDDRSFELSQDAQKYTDPKPLIFLEEIGFLESEANGRKKFRKISKEILSRYYNRLRNLKIYNIDKDRDADVDKSYSTLCDKPFNRILFGAPGTGKSDKLKKEVEGFVSPTNYERVTFYPDYTYSQFVGAYKPITDGGEIKYKFVLGPFGRILREAYAKPEENFVLVIEEINRAKAAAVFGDVFQLLDREQNGESTYDIQISDEFKKELGIEHNRIKLPNNLYIWATMNSADQGVFPLDSAFKRRWSFEYINVDNDKNKIADWTIKIKDQIYKWDDLRCAINKVLSTNFGVNEDKLLGAFFLKQNELNKDSFKSKVLMYLFEDVVRTRRSDFFYAEQYNKFSAICEKFDNEGLAVFRDKTISDSEHKSSTSDNSAKAPAETEA